VAGSLQFSSQPITGELASMYAFTQHNLPTFFNMLHILDDAHFGTDTEHHIDDIEHGSWHWTNADDLLCRHVPLICSADNPR
jgi:hypothetical protein